MKCDGFFGENTQVVEDLKWKFADDVENFFQQSEQYFVRFASLLYEKAQTRGYTGDPEDVQALTDFVYRRVVDTGGTLSKMTIRNWLCKSKPICSASSRDNVYQLCFALEMDEQEAYLFFVKAYWDHPFDFRQMDECVYWYCLKNHLTYTRAKRILEEVQKTKSASIAPFQETTAQLEAGLERCEDERSLVEYLASNWDSFEERGCHRQKGDPKAVGAMHRPRPKAHCSSKSRRQERWKTVRKRFCIGGDLWFSS